MPRVQRNKLLVDQVTEAIRKQIVTAQVPFGAKLSENALAAELGVSTTPVREAFGTLRTEGLVTVRPQSGTYVFELEQGELQQLCELRFALEPAAVARSLELGNTGIAATLAQIVEDMRKAQTAEDVEAYLDLDTAFHDAIIAAAHNPYLSGAYALIGPKMAALRNRLGRDPHHMRKSLAEHAEIAAAIARSEGAAAVDILRRHIMRKEGSYWEHFCDMAEKPGD